MTFSGNEREFHSAHFDNDVGFQIGVWFGHNLKFCVGVDERRRLEKNNFSEIMFIVRCLLYLVEYES